MTTYGFPRPAEKKASPITGADAAVDSSVVLEVMGPVWVALLLYVGFFKAAPFMQWAPVDLTVVCLLAVAVLITCRLVLIRGRILLPQSAVALVALCVPAAFYTLTNPATSDKRLRLLITLAAAMGALTLVRSYRAQRVWICLHVLLGVAFVLTAPNADADTALRFVGAGSNTIGAGRASGVAVIVLLILALQRGLRRPFTAVGSVLLATWLATALISTGSRGPVFACAATILIVTLLSARRGRTLRILAAAGAVIAGWLFLADATGLGATRISDSLNGRYTFAESRGGLWENAVRAIPTHPLGAGWGNFWALLSPFERLESGYAQYPHNVIIEVFVEAGWLAGVSAIVFVVASLRQLQRHSHHPQGAALLGIAIFFVINAMVSGDVNDNRMMWAALAIGWVSAPIATGETVSGTRASAQVRHGARREQGDEISGLRGSRIRPIKESRKWIS